VLAESEARYAKAAAGTRDLRKAAHCPLRGL
jgi:hypothetical protein